MALRRSDHHTDARTERIERVEHIDHTMPATPATNVNVGPTAAAVNDAVVIFTRVVMLVFTVLEVLLLFRFIFKLAGANAGQPLIAWLYGITEPLVRPFQGIFPEPRGIAVVDIAALLSIVFLFLIGWLIVALVRAIAGRPVA
ncbi:MAG TPA: YggT family protein [Candidatus Limnocylindria bacterium]|jgi:uncharacterized protein YggT (Ycf19 family)|nr:YggT family protein [Candidatus Limnocylindria bacterium]